MLDGGFIAPGDPVTLSLNGDLTWNGGGVFRLVLGADAAGSDHLVVHSLVRGTDGAFEFDLVDFGMTAGGSYELLKFDRSADFKSSDFSFIGLAGRFETLDGRLTFTTSAVPEPGSAQLWVLGWPVLCTALRGRKCIGCHLKSAHRELCLFVRPGLIPSDPTAWEPPIGSTSF